MPDDLPLFLLDHADCRAVARQLSCGQDIAADGCFSLGMLAEFDAALAEGGPAAYRRLFWEAGAIGQALYLEAEAAGLRGTGIGCFFDDGVHQLLGITDHALQSLYHFTVGGPVDDPRLTTHPGYPWENRAAASPVIGDGPDFWQRSSAPTVTADVSASVRREQNMRPVRIEEPAPFGVSWKDMALEQSQILQALTAVKDPDLHKDIVKLGFVKDVSIDGGRVAFTIELTTPACPVKEQMKEQARAAVMQLPGVTDVDHHDDRPGPGGRVAGRRQGPDSRREERHRRRRGEGRRRQDHGGREPRAGARADRRAASASSTPTSTGPNVPIMLGLQGQLGTDGEKIVPPEKYGLQVVSMGFLTSDDAPVIWRGPMLHGVIRQFFMDVRWDDLDYLVVDLPPGTGDVALSLSQTAYVAGAIVVTTPQQVAVADTRRAVAMYQKLNIPVLGLIENMSYFVVPVVPARERHLRARRRRAAGRGAGHPVPREHSRSPSRCARGGDTGVPIMLTDPTSPAAEAFVAAAERTAAQVSIQSFRTPVIPLKPVN